MTLSFSEDLVLAEDRTTEADRELIMGGKIPSGIDYVLIYLDFLQTQLSFDFNFFLFC